MFNLMSSTREIKKNFKMNILGRMGVQDRHEKNPTEINAII